MKKYPEYRDSGIEWLGDVPSDWKILRLKSLIIKSTNGVWGSEPEEDENDLICVRVADFDMDKFGVSEEKLTTRNIPSSQQNGRLLSKDNLLIEKSGGGEKQPVGRVIKYDLDKTAVCSNFIANIDCNNNVDPNFLVYLFSYLYSLGVNTRSIKQTTGIQNLDTGLYFNEKVTVPPTSEQTAIANFLDHKTRQIDDLIDKKQQLIELLKEERTAVINQAVTKGLDPTVPMKDSGIEWLGEIPEHWEVKRLKFLSKTIQTGSTPPTGNSEYYDNPDYDWYTPVDFNNGIYLDNSNRKINSIALRDGVAKEFDSNTVLIVGIGATLGKIGILKKTSSSNQQVNAIIFTEDQSPIYHGYYLQSIESIIRMMSNAATLAILNQSNTKNLLMLCPPKEEQDQIATKIDSLYRTVDKQINDITKQTKYLLEYKTSLINEAVTGKIKVTDAT